MTILYLAQEIGHHIIITQLQICATLQGLIALIWNGFSRESIWIRQLPSGTHEQMADVLRIIRGNSVEVISAIDPDSTLATESCCMFSQPLSAFVCSQTLVLSLSNWQRDGCYPEGRKLILNEKMFSVQKDTLRATPSKPGCEHVSQNDGISEHR